ncbi:MAG: membrane integrity-associated transporter subunit PqiC [Parahaliea sp.]
MTENTPMRTPLKWMLLAAVLLAGGCSTSPTLPVQHTYLLRSPPPAEGPQALADISIDQVILPAYLQRDEMVLMISSNEIKPARHHRWGEPLERNIQRYLRQQLARHLADLAGTGAIHITLELDELLGNLDGVVYLRGNYRIAREGGEPVEGHLEFSVQQERDGYDGLVAAHQVLLDRSAAAMVAALRQPD